MNEKSRILRKAIRGTINKGKSVTHHYTKIKLKKILESILMRTSREFIGIPVPEKSLESHKISGRVF